MTTLRRRRAVLAALLVLACGLTVVLLFEVLGTVFFAITVAYALYPARQMLVERGLGQRVASLLATALAFLAVVLLVAPLAYALYQRRFALLAFLADLPEEVTVALGEFSYMVDVAALVASLRTLLTGLAVDLARQSPVLALKLFLFTVVVYALLLRPMAIRDATTGVVPSGYHDILVALDDRVRSTLFAIYVLQAATAVATFVLALVVFWALGYESYFSLAVVSGILQFIPVVGPSLVIAGLALFDLALGDPVRAVIVATVGTFVIGFLPDAVIRPRLAARTTSLPGSVYFIGFTGGVLSVGAVGIIAGPLAVALLVELVTLLSD